MENFNLKGKQREKKRKVNICLGCQRVEFIFFLFHFHLFFYIFLLINQKSPNKQNEKRTKKMCVRVEWVAACQGVGGTFLGGIINYMP